MRQSIRKEQKTAERVRVVYGALVSYVALATENGEHYDISAALGSIVPLLEEEATKPEKEFGMLVRNRRRVLGLPLMEGEKILPFCPRVPVPNQPEPDTLDVAPKDPQQRQQWHAQLAQRRMLEALDVWQQAQVEGKPLLILRDLEGRYQLEALVYSTAMHYLRL
jgi:hypothetical protein